MKVLQRLIELFRVPPPTPVSSHRRFVDRAVYDPVRAQFDLESG